MKCPHCLTAFNVPHNTQRLDNDKDATWFVRHRKCPECEKVIVELVKHMGGLPGGVPHVSEELVYPRASSRPPLSSDVPERFTADYKEACLVLPDSEKASAALSRRCLQHLLREHVKIKPGTLDEEIQRVLDSHELPSYLSENLDTVRVIGNFATHPLKSTSTGEIVEVEPGEAESQLDILEGLFDFYFVQPAAQKKKREQLNEKLKAIGKRPLKEPTK